MQKLRYYHRLATVVIVVFTLFLGVTGTVIQLTDLKSILTHAPADDPNVEAMRESFDGPEDFQVREPADYLAKPLPANADYQRMLTTAITAARSALGQTPLKYMEFRMAGSIPVAQVGVGDGHVQFDAVSGALRDRTSHDELIIGPKEGASIRNDFKHLHRMTTFGDWALIINLIVAIGLPVMIVTGIWIYAKLLLGRKKIKRPGFWWKGGGVWRQTHRWISIAAAGFLLAVTFSGGWLAIESAGLAIYMREHMPPGGFKPHPGPRPRPDASTPLVDAQLPAMLSTTVDRLKADAPNDPIKVIRLRTYAGYPQGVVVTGGDNSQQLVYNTRTGAAMSETEPGYPPVPFPFGWQAHQFAKHLHRGDFIGLTGRWMDLLAGFAMIYLSLSGLVMYWQMWRKRRLSGRNALLWA